jgi:hypothetical protein
LLPSTALNVSEGTANSDFEHYGNLNRDGG